jgi:hypothetical protein
MATHLANARPIHARGSRWLLTIPGCPRIEPSGTHGGVKAGAVDQNPDELFCKIILEVPSPSRLPPHVILGERQGATVRGSATEQHCRARGPTRVCAQSERRYNEGWWWRFPGATLGSLRDTSVDVKEGLGGREGGALRGWRCKRFAYGAALLRQFLQNGLRVPLHGHILSLPTHGQFGPIRLARNCLRVANVVGVDPHGLVGARVGELNELV